MELMESMISNESNEYNLLVDFHQIRTAKNGSKTFLNKPYDFYNKMYKLEDLTVDLIKDFAVLRVCKARESAPRGCRTCGER